MQIIIRTKDAIHARIDNKSLELTATVDHIDIFESSEALCIDVLMFKLWR